MAQATIAFPKVAGSANAYTVTSGQPIRVATAQATFDGTAAAGPFLACLSIFSQDGRLLSRSFPSQPVAAGDTAKVSFFPGVAAGGGIEFDTHNSGDWLEVTTTDANPDTLDGIFLNATGANGNMDIDASQILTIHGTAEVDVFNLGGQVDITPAGGLTLGSAVGTTLTTSGAAPNIIAQSGTGEIRVNTAPSGAGNLKITLRHTGAMTLWNDHLNAAIFEIREDGSIHGRAAVGAITWDL